MITEVVLTASAVAGANGAAFAAGAVVSNRLEARGDNRDSGTAPPAHGPELPREPKPVVAGRA